MINADEINAELVRCMGKNDRNDMDSYFEFNDEAKEVRFRRYDTPRECGHTMALYICR